MLSLQSRLLRIAIRPGAQCLATASSGKKGSGGNKRKTKQRNVLGMKMSEVEDRKVNLKQEFLSNPELVRQLDGNKEAMKWFSVEFGDANDAYNLDLYKLYTDVCKFDCNERVDSKHYSNNYSDTGIPAEKDEKVKAVVVNHVKMKYLAEKLPFDPAQLRGPQIKYHPHMEVEVIAKHIANRKGREEVIWKRSNYVRMKQAEFAKALGNRYDSYYVFKREKAENKRLNYSRNNFFFRWVYYHGETDEPYELHGKVAAQMHRWTELKEARDTALREIELEDILKYRHVINVLEIPPLYVPTFKLPKPKWFRNHSISCLSEAEVSRLRAKRKHGAISKEEEDNVTVPNRPTKFSELTVGWGRADQNVYIDTDYPFGVPVPSRDSVPLPQIPVKKAIEAPDGESS